MVLILQINLFQFHTENKWTRAPLETLSIQVISFPAHLICLLHIFPSICMVAVMHISLEETMKLRSIKPIFLFRAVWKDIQDKNKSFYLLKVTAQCGGADDSYCSNEQRVSLKRDSVEHPSACHRHVLLSSLKSSGWAVRASLLITWWWWKSLPDHLMTCTRDQSQSIPTMGSAKALNTWQPSLKHLCQATLYLWPPLWLIRQTWSWCQLALGAHTLWSADNKHPSATL